MIVKLNLGAINKEFAKIKLVYYVAVYTDGTACVLVGQNRKHILRSVRLDHLHDLKKIKTMQGRFI